jgi:hypothetical protein
MGQGEDTFSANRNFVSVGFMIPSRKLLAWSYCLLTNGVQIRSIACGSSWSSCVPNNTRARFAKRCAFARGSAGALGVKEIALEVI